MNPLSFLPGFLEQRLIRYVLSDHWALGVSLSSQEKVFARKDLGEITWIRPTGDRFFADPFVLQRGSWYYIFFEEFDFRLFRGHISYVATDDGRRFTAPTPVIVEPFHLSYPCLFEAGNEIYCVPEQNQAGRVDLYKAIDFPIRWQRAETIVPGLAGVDPTVLFHDGRWWLFVCDAKDPRVPDLLLFSAPHPTGPWKPHKNNPVKSDAATGRPGGRVFQTSEGLIRPTQDSRRRQADRVMFNRITRLDDEAYEEEQVGVLESKPDWPYADGLHTFSGAGDITVIDSRNRRMDRAFAWQMVRHRLWQRPGSTE